jgi:hypothetical protein
MKTWGQKLLLFLILYSLFAIPYSPVLAQTRTLGGFPRIFNLWENWDASHGASFQSTFNAITLYSDGTNDRDKQRADQIHALNPNAIVLLTADAVPAHDVGAGQDVQPQWWSAARGTPDYACIYRNASGTILRDATYQAAYNNLSLKYCRDILIAHFINNWTLSGGHFDGWYMDQMGGGGVSQSLGNNIDENGDGVAENITQVDTNYHNGMISFMTDLRSALRQNFPSTYNNIIIMNNDSPVDYSQWINGRYFETDMRNYLDKHWNLPWTTMMDNFSPWVAQNTQLPNMTDIANTGDQTIIDAKYTAQNIWSNIKPPMMTEYSSDFSRMRFGLISALMTGAMYSYDLGSYMYGMNWWYDEFGTAGQPATTGYLGQPTGPKTLAVDHLDTPDDVTNGDFGSGMTNWNLGKSSANVIASAAVENTGGHNNTPGVHIAIGSNPASEWLIFSQKNISTSNNIYRNVSFWAKADTNRRMGVRIQRSVSPWDYLTQASNFYVTTQWNEFNIPLKGVADVNDLGTLMFDIGIQTGNVYLDDIKMQDGTLGVWQRPFDHGLVLLNESQLPQAVPLARTYQKLTGSQAPLFAARVDDDKAVANGSWNAPTATFDQWGLTVHTIAPNNTATMTYTANLPYAGQYEVFAWVVPASPNSSGVTATIRHAQGDATVTLDETAGALGWHSLGIYAFNANSNPSVILTATGNGTVIADAIKWVSLARYNDGSDVNQVTIQPDDGIILLNSANQIPTATPIPSPTPIPPTPTAPAGKPGDANGDNKVDGQDYVVWLSHFGQTMLGSANGDFNNDGKVNGQDYVVWLNNYGK